MEKNEETKNKPKIRKKNDGKVKIDEKDVAIVIPIWKSIISNDELMSLLQCDSVLGKYDKFFIHPQRLDKNYYASIINEMFLNKRCGKLTFLQFEDRHFESRNSYSSLLISKSFYSNFSKYKYILIYQTDAWVFKDELTEWCNRGYDYIGAPWCHLCERCLKSSGNSIFSTGFVGNGGFSLRNVESFINELPYENPDEIQLKDEMIEDIYLATMNRLSRPCCNEAAKFSVEVGARNLIEKFGIPFGFHNVRIYDNAFYSELISSSFARKELLKNNG